MSLLTVPKATMPADSNARMILGRVLLPILLASMALSVGTRVVYAQAVNGWTVWSWGTTSDAQGIDIGPISDRTCVLSGVSGNLDLGAQPGFGCDQGGRESTALINISNGHYRLIAHGGACEDQTNKPFWNGNPVNAEATCFLTATNVTSGEWNSLNPVPIKVAELGTGNSSVRQCFLSGFFGVGGAWNNDNSYAHVRKVLNKDNTHPATGWYIEANLPTAADASHPRVDAICLDFPSGTVLDKPGYAGPMPTTQTYQITTGTGVKACGLTGLSGPLNQNSWTNGVLMTFPKKVDGNWSLTVSADHSALWQCVR